MTFLHLFISTILSLSFVHDTIILAQSTNPLQNNQILSSNITSGAQHHFYFSTKGNTLTARSLEKTLSYFNSFDGQVNDLSIGLGILNNKRAPNTIMDNSTNSVYLTLTSCSQPSPPSNYQGDIPSIDLYLSKASSNTLPGPTNNQNNDTVDDTKPGRISWQGDHISDLWIGVVAPTLTTGWTGQWTYELGISTNQWMHPLHGDNDSLTLDDTDNTHALFLSPPYSTQQQPKPNFTALVTQNMPKELEYSYCAAKSYQVSGYSINVTETQRGHPGQQNGIPLTQQQIMISNLTLGQNYTVYMVEQQQLPISSPTTPATTIIGTATPLKIYTKSNANCRMMYNLDFCSDVAYSVPTDPTHDIWNITYSYDQQAQALFEPFATALSQFNCNNTQYSLVRNCDDCYRDYKRWLCAVTIPRCTDNSTSISSTISTRDVANGSSRNPWIDSAYQPGEWTELLPCIDVCYQVVQSCPPFLQFNCPEDDLARQQYGYWKVNGSLGINRPTCNRLNMNVSLLVISHGIRLSLSSSLLISLFIFYIIFYSL
ncbi:stretch-activated Ca2+-permeable channel component-domain-containing protein [Halteromyces radiatus]|uniref:stretch-activated Ca2+-permeable channel component-domain-containing protein n=1 Tax=Halteromyces radiatus TaxID=101107 RepID=UPI00221E75A9|nr:stretch-activated Ca2+-permeable channel component-domain-containing protein [Halteromyces radiatus]KAI8092956.1 stretch-activated Ca2+-permeable channel component-domain-containing protein [Halteromyces radiatus]